MLENLFYNLITELVYREMKLRNQNYSNIANVINKSEDYIRKINSVSSEKRYNLEHLYLLANFWKIPIDNLLPNKDNIATLEKYSQYSEKDIIKLLENIFLFLKGEHYE